MNNLPNPPSAEMLEALREQRAANLGQALRTLRTNAGMTLQQLSTAAGVGQRYLSQAETGKVHATDGWVRMVVEAIAAHIAATATPASVPPMVR